jgi:hypothetical protein|tara:strand:+ start:261 stop:890 length:630 start_codon:yes stop_codon:yes gene_type:complete
MDKTNEFYWYWDGNDFRNKNENVDKKRNPHLYKNNQKPPAAKEKYINEQTYWDEALGKFIGRDTGRVFPDAAPAIRQNTNFDQLKYINGMVREEPWAYKENQRRVDLAAKMADQEQKKEKLSATKKWNVIKSKMNPTELEEHYKSNPEDRPVKPVQINYKPDPLIAEMEELNRIKIQGDIAARKFREAMKPAVDEDVNKGIGTFAPRKF